ncbi:hypothetical protein SAMN05421823_105289 [Catalinimonas alkaloidigena]|uniref:Uncharacterized protein n=1 Tax=Catalinimonas alkaloidigena TaxID=1075417 RepID=A0A1G9JE37_9BACT|nr:hypothetical protein [Catalinimonas alkaloidigena]SDL35800.1 hypothetical protein SAMN05421823_105289 [Catalinimonas alkaloidigena]
MLRKRRRQREREAIRRVLDRQKLVFGIQVSLLAVVLGGFMLWAWWTYRPVRRWTPPGEIWIYTIATLYLAILVGSQIAFRKVLERIPVRQRLRTKIRYYFYANLIRYSGYEIVGMLCIGAYFFTGHLIYLGFTLLSLVLYIIYRPAREIIVEELHLHEREARLLFEA